MLSRRRRGHRTVTSLQDTQERSSCELASAGVSKAPATSGTVVLRPSNKRRHGRGSKQFDDDQDPAFFTPTFLISRFRKAKKLSMVVGGRQPFHRHQR